MSNEHLTDYQPGDFPVPVGVVVEYQGRDWEVVDREKPREGTADPETNYPDGAAYVLCPLDVDRKSGNLDQAMWQVHRRSFRVKPAWARQDRAEA
ncbi:hypothetical protein [Streptomyces sp. NPDC088752]|uniref:hypothetical protein n=1 Tax=Streptomyces sp. NPDC088752 TaxID=3154963 RepID=UPI00341F4FEC